MVKLKRPKFTKLQLFVHIGALIPLILLLWDFYTDNLTADPVQNVTLRTGKTALVVLILTLAVTPINTVFGFRSVLRVRRALGLYSFLYVGLHFLTFIGLDYVFNLNLIYEAIFEKRYALVGFAAGMIMIPLALTSTKGWMKRLGKTWTRIHQFVYLAALLGALHYVWLVKSDIREPLIYAGVIIILLILRVPVVRKNVTRLRNQYQPRLRTKANHIRNGFRARIYPDHNGVG
jgi:sulfoxide reductase heme-binding subunit YedZ